MKTETPIEKLMRLAETWGKRQNYTPANRMEDDLRETLAACQAATDGKTWGQVLWEAFGDAALGENSPELHANYEKAALAVLVAAHGSLSPEACHDAYNARDEALRQLEKACARLALLEWRTMDVRPTREDGDSEGDITLIDAFGETYACHYAEVMDGGAIAWRPCAAPPEADPFTAWHAKFGGTREAFEAARKGVA